MAAGRLRGALTYWRTWTSVGFIAALSFSVGLTYPALLADLGRSIGLNGSVVVELLIGGSIALAVLSLVVALALTTPPNQEPADEDTE